MTKQSQKSKSELDWQEVWAFCIVELGLPEERIFTLSFTEFQALRNAWVKKVEREDAHSAKICFFTVNAIGQALGSKKTAPIETFMFYKQKKPSAEKVDEKELYNLFRSSFGPAIKEKKKHG